MNYLCPTCHKKKDRTVLYKDSGGEDLNCDEATLNMMIVDPPKECNKCKKYYYKWECIEDEH